MTSKTSLKPENAVIELLIKHKSMSVDELVAQLCHKQNISERQIKETIWTLLEQRIIEPNKHWQMKMRSS